MEVFVVSCEDRLFIISLLETFSKEKISSVRGVKADDYLGLNLYMNQESSLIIQVLTKTGIHDFKQQSMKD